MPFNSKIFGKVYQPINQKRYSLPLFTCPVSAGFPSPADDYLEGKLDLNQHLVKNPVATFFVRVSGDSMVGAGIHSGDLLIVDRSLEPRNNKVIIAVVDGELLVKRIRIEKRKVYLTAENPDYPPLASLQRRRFANAPEMDFQVWGVVTNVIHPL